MIINDTLKSLFYLICYKKYKNYRFLSAGLWPFCYGEESVFASFSEAIHLMEPYLLSFLPKLKVKTLLTVGQYDFVTPSACQYYANEIHNAQLEVIAAASHHARILQEFLTDYDNRFCYLVLRTKP